MPEPEYHDLHVHKAAAETIQACAEQAAAVHDFWVKHASDVRRTGGHLADYARPDDKTLTSWSRQVSLLFNTFFGGQSTVTKDGCLSLCTVTNTGFTYGLVFHAAYRADLPEPDDLRPTPTVKAMGRHCFHDGLNCFKPLTGGECSQHGRPSLGAALPLPGEWSFHS
jgi:hypothetical protein